MSKALEGIRILDFGRFISGPFGGMLLADMGAEVIRVEKTGGDAERNFLPFKNGKSVFVSIYARNKKCITLNFRSEEGKKLLYKLVEKSDVVISNFRAGVMEKMGLGYETAKKINPRIIMAEISGFGQEGTYKDRIAFDGVATAMSGVMYNNYTYGSGPHSLGSPIADISTGYANALAIMVALFQRERTGSGQFIDTAMVDCMVPFLSSALPTTYLHGLKSKPGSRLGGDPNTAPSNIFKVKDGFIYMHAGTDPHYKLLCRLINNEELYQEKYQTITGRLADFEHLEALVGKWLLDKTSEEAEKLICGAGIPFSKVNSIKDLLKDKYASDRRQVIWMDVPDAGKIPYVGNPLKLSDSEVEYLPGHEIGQDNQSVYIGLLGLSETEFQDYQNRGII